MKQRFADILDQALAQEFAGQAQDQVLLGFPQHAQRLKLLLETARTLDCIQEAQIPEPAMLEADRRQFLRAVNQLENQPVSPGPLGRINNWMAAVIPFYAIKQPLRTQEKWKMSPIFVNIVLMIIMLVASAGGTVAVAASSLPDSPLYPVKLAVEKIQVGTLADPEKLAAQHLVLAQNRSREIIRQAQLGIPVEQSTTLRLQEHFNLALQYTAQLGETEMSGLLMQAQHMIQEQLQEMEQVRSSLKLEQQESLQEPVRFLQQTQARVQAGLEDPLAFREQTRSGIGEVGGNPDCPLGECLPTGDEYHYRHRRGQPELRFNRARAGYSPSDEIVELGAEDLAGSEQCPNDTCIPEGDEYRYGPAGESPGPGQPGGNPDPDCTDCEPSGDENKYGQQPDQPGPGQPGSNPDCPQADCYPEGDQHQEGQPPDPGDESGSGDNGEGSAGGGGAGSAGQVDPGNPGGP